MATEGPVEVTKLLLEPPKLKELKRTDEHNGGGGKRLGFWLANLSQRGGENEPDIGEQQRRHSPNLHEVNTNELYYRCTIDALANTYQ